MFIKHKTVERNIFLMVVLSLITVSIGGIVEIVPLFTIENTYENHNIKGIRPYSPLELAGRDIYIREGCYNCHSQMIRPFRDEAERYGHYSIAAESQYDHPFQWGSKRTGPDLARVGGKYSNQWHRQHLTNPRDVVEASIMPTYGFLKENLLNYKLITKKLKTMRFVGVPYSDEDIAQAKVDLISQATPDADHTALLKRYPKAVVGNFDGRPQDITEMDALIAYLQMLGTLVDFKDLKAENLLQSPDQQAVKK